MDEYKGPTNPQGIESQGPLCRRPGCEVRNCESHCICPHCLCHRHAIGTGHKKRWCRRCKKGKCGRDPGEACPPRGIKKQPCRHEGCKQHPCREHCQCRECFPCHRTPRGATADAQKFFNRCTNCYKKRCCTKAQLPSGASYEPPQDVVVPMTVVASSSCIPTRDAEVQSTAAAAACAGVPRMLRQLNPDKPLSAEDVEIARFRAGRPDYPLLGMIVRGNEDGIIVSMQPTLYYPGTGRLTLPEHSDSFALDSYRVAFSFALLHQKALCGFFGLPILKDLTTRQWDVRADAPYVCDGMSGSSSGALAALALLQATSNCVFPREVAITGELSLSGQMWPVERLNEKLEGAARAGLKKAILPPAEPEKPLPIVPAGVEVVKVSTIFEAINHMVIGCGRKVVSRGGYPCLPDLVVATSILQSIDERHWVRRIEIAAVPGAGQVHITGDVETNARNAIAVALQAVVENLDTIQSYYMSKDVTRKIDLVRLCRVGGEAGTLDLHVNLAPNYLPVHDCNSTLAVALGLIALAFGLHYPSDVSVCGHLTVGGRVVLNVLLQPSYVTETRKLGARKLVMCSENAHRVMPQEQAMAAAGDAQEGARAEVAVADTLFQAISHVFPMHIAP